MMAVAIALMAMGAGGCAFEPMDAEEGAYVELSDGSDELELSHVVEPPQPVDEVDGADDEVTSVPEAEAAPDFGQGRLLTDPNPLPWHEQGTKVRSVRGPSSY